MIRLFIKVWRDHWKSVLAWAAVLIFMASVQLSVYPSVTQSAAAMQQFIDAFPEALKKIFRMQDYTSGAGFLSTELYSLIFPLVLIAIAVSWGASATAEEEERGTADLLFALPVSRTRILLTKMAATISVVLFLGLLTLVTIIIGSGPAKLTVDYNHLFFATISLVLGGLFFGGLAFLAGAVFGRKGAAIGLASGLAVIGFMLYSLSGLVSRFDSVKPVNPWEWILSGNVLFDGADWAGMVKLFLGCLVLFGATITIFRRRDLSAG